MNYIQTYENYELEEKERIKKHHRTRFIVYLVLWLCSGFTWFICSLLGLLAGGIMGMLLMWLVAVGLGIAFLVLWIYHLIKWLNA